MNRQDMVEAGADAIHGRLAGDENRSNMPGNLSRVCARAVLDAVLPQITEAKQLRDVPEGSVLCLQRDEETYFYTWRGRFLDNLGGSPGFIPEYILQWGPLTVVWRPDA